MAKKFKFLLKVILQQLPWRDLGVDVVIESTGVSLQREDAEKHIEAGAKKVIISAPAYDEDITSLWVLTMTSMIQLTDHVVSNASCTTNCLAPFAKVLNDNLVLNAE